MSSNTRSFKKRLFFLFTLAAALVTVFSIFSFGAATTHVYNGQSIQNAIDTASPGDTITVHDGTYSENINITKQLTIQSENGFATTIISANPTDHAVDISASNVSIKGFTIYGATDPSMAGVFLSSSASNCTITRNRFGDDQGHSNAIGISLSSSNNNRIYLNSFENNTSHVSSSSSANTWSSPKKLIYTYNGSKHHNYLGNYFSDRIGNDDDSDGIGSVTYTTDGTNDPYSLWQALGNYTNIGIDITPIITMMMLDDPLPVITFTANPDSIYSGETSLLQWSTSNANSVVITPDIGSVFLNGETIVTPSDTTTYTLIATGNGKSDMQDTTITVSPMPPPPTASLNANPLTIVNGETGALTWTSENANTCIIEPGIGSVPTSGETIISPTVTTDYTLTAGGPGGPDATSSVTVNVVTYQPTASINANPDSIVIGESSTLTWSSEYADSCSIEPGIGNVPPSGETHVSPTSTTQYTITATGPGGEAEDNATVNVTYPEPTVGISADPEIIKIGNSSRLTWNTTYADSVIIDNGVGTVGLNGSYYVSPEQTTIYTIFATGPGGTSISTATVTVQDYDPDKYIIAAIDSSKIDEDLTDFPVLIHLSDNSGMGGYNASGMFKEFDPNLDPNDNFTQNGNNLPDDTRWTIAGYPDYAKIKYDKLNLKANSVATHNYIQSNNSFWLRGDFDIQVDFDIVAGSSAQGWHGYLGVYTSQGYMSRIQREYHTSFGGQCYRHYSYNGSSGFNEGYITRNDASGKLRITRTGSRFTTYTWYNDQWNQINSSNNFTSIEDVYVQLGVYTHTDTPYAEVNYDNFQVNSGNIVYQVQPRKFAVYAPDGSQCYTEIEKWDHRNKQAWLWVKVPEVSSTVDTQLKICYDKDMQDNLEYVGEASDRLDYQMVVDIGTVGSYNSAHSYSPYIIKDGDTYKMWYSGHDGSNWRILYAESSDGMNWSDPQMVLNIGAEGTYDTTYAYAPCVIKEDDMYKIWYSGNNSDETRIIYSTSTDGKNWNDPEPIIGVQGTYDILPDDKISTTYPCVIKEGSTYKMWYTGGDGTNARILYAESTDGINWSNHKMVIDHNILGNHDSKHAHTPYVIKDGDTYKIWYAGSDGTTYRMLYAYSIDGIIWTDHQLVLDIGSEGTYDTNHAYASNVLKENGKYRMWYAGYNGSNYRILYTESNLPTFTTPSQKVWDKNFRSVWHMSQDPSGGTGAIKDSTKYGLHGTSMGSMTFSDLISTKIGNGIDFDGNDDGLIFPHSTSINLDAYNDSYTIELLLKVPSQSDYRGMEKAASGQPYPVSYQGNWYVYDRTNIPGVAHSPFDDMWHNDSFVVDNDADELRSYVDGIISDSTPNTLTSSTTNTGNLAIFNNAAQTRGLQGQLDETRISTVVRSSAWLRATHFSNFDNLISYNASPTFDADNDGINDVDETNTYGTNPYSPDSDGDGINDGDELAYWGANWNQDIDGDGVINLLDDDADGDGFNDGEELSRGFDPGDPNSTPPALPQITFSANPETISPGGSSTIQWSVTNAETVTIDNGIGSVALSGSLVVSPMITTTYTMTATGPGGTETSSVTVSNTGIDANQYIIATIDSSKIDEDLKDFPVLIVLSDDSGTGGYNALNMFEEFAPNVDPDDDFTQNGSNLPDDTQWTTIGYPDFSKLQYDKLNLKADSTSTHNYVHSKDRFFLKGDFDIQVDFDIPAISSSQGWHGYLGVYTSQGYMSRIQREYHTSFGGQCYRHYSYNGSSGFNEGYITRNDASGKLRITRVGSIFTAYAWYNGQWNPVSTDSYFTTSEDVYIQLGVYTHTDTPYAEINFDNFKVNSGSTVYQIQPRKFAVYAPDGSQCYTEIEKWDYGNKEAWLWVKVPEVSSTVDTQLKICYDKDMQDNLEYVGEASDKLDYQMVVDIGTVGTYNSAHSYSPHVIKDGDTYKMWYAGHNGTNWRILYADSTDGINWMNHQMVLNIGSQGTYDAVHVYDPFVIKENDLYKLWYVGYDGINARILYSDSTDGINWSNHQLAMDIGVEGTYDTTNIYWPRVIKDGDNYKMWYAGYDGTNVRILYAESSDSISWTNHQMVLDHNILGDYDSIHAHVPFLIKDGDTYKMWYTGYDGTNYRTLYANSTDGINWKDHQLVLDIGSQGTYDSKYAFAPSVLKEDGKYKMWYAGHDGSNYRILYTESNLPTFKTPSQNVWDKNFRGVWHLSQTPMGAGSIIDSTFYANNGRSYNMDLSNIVDVAAGQGVHFNGVDERIAFPVLKDLMIRGDISIEYCTMSPLTVASRPVIHSGYGDNASANCHYSSIVLTDGRLRMFFEYGAGVNQSPATVNSYITPNNENYISMNRDTSEKIVSFFVDGLYKESIGYAQNPTDGTATTLSFGANDQNSTPNLYTELNLREVRISTIPRKDSWIKATYFSNYDNLVAYTTSPALDSDGDGISDADEINTYGTDPYSLDSDGDGINDGDELAYWGANWNQDIDGDGVINLLDDDSDGDGVNDGEELAKGYDPADINSTPPPLPEISLFTVNPVRILNGQSTTLQWITTDADTVSIDNGVGSVALTGSVDVAPTQTTTYTITATGPGGESTATIKVSVGTVFDDMYHGFGMDEYQGGGGLIAETVRMTNGNMLQYRSDVSFPSPHSMGLSFTAFYNSRSQIQGVHGFGWTHTYDLNFEPIYDVGPDTYLQIIDQTGRAHYFEYDVNSGNFIGLLNERTHVTIDGNNYTWHRLDGLKYGFSLSDYKLEYIEDEKANRLNMAYDIDGRLDTVTDSATGRVLDFDYNDDGLLAFINGPTTSAVSFGIWAAFEYDTNGNLTSVAYPDGSGFTYFYEDPTDVHNLTKKQNKAEYLINTWAYDTSDRCVDNFSPNGTGAAVNYASDTQVNSTDAHSVVRTYSIADVNGEKRITSMQGLANAPYSSTNAIRWDYDANGNLTEIEYKGGTINQYQNYDNHGNPGTVILAVGTSDERTITYTYHPDMNVLLSRSETSVLGSGNKVTTWDYDTDMNQTYNENPQNQVTQIIEQGFTKDNAGTVVPYTYTTAMTYNADGQVVSVDGPVPGTDDVTTMAYDPATKDILSITRPVIGSTTFSGHDNAGQVGTVTDVNSQSKSFMYDGRGRIRQTTNNADGSTSTVNYTSAGLPDSTADEDGVNRFYSYGPVYGRLARTTDHEGNYIAYEYDGYGNKTRQSYHDPVGSQTSFRRWSYDHPTIPGMLYREINGDDTFTQYSYDNSGKVSSIKDPKGNSTIYTYDAMNRIETVSQPGTILTTYDYDAHGNLASVTDAENHETTYEYDDMGRVLTITSPDTGVTTHVYDEAGNPVSKTDAKGITVQYSYDILNRLTGAVFPDTTQNITYAYDAGTNGMGRRTSMTDPSGSTAFGYDNRGRLVSKTTSINSVANPYVISRSYTPGSRISNFTYPDGRTIDYDRSSCMCSISKVSTTHNSVTKTLVNNLDYRPFGSAQGMTTDNGGTVTNIHDQNGRLVVANPGAPKEESYTYDANGNLTSKSGKSTPWFNRTFTYDALNRLTDATGSFGTLGYTYDKVGNRISLDDNGQASNYNYVPNSNKLDSITGANPVNYTYDANGNITGINNKVLTYNQNNRLIKVEQDGNVLGEYTYNGLGQRVSKQVGTDTTYFIYDFDGHLIAEAGTDGAITMSFLYMGQNRMARVDSSGNFLYYLNDSLGTPLMLTDETNTVVWEGLYKPFGEAEVNPNSTVENNFRFPGQYYDSETGLHYNYHRYYDTNSGRYLKADPIGLDGGLNLYVYVLNNPVNTMDPSGTKGPVVQIDFSLNFFGFRGNFGIDIAFLHDSEHPLYNLDSYSGGLYLSRVWHNPLNSENEDEKSLGLYLEIAGIGLTYSKADHAYQRAGKSRTGTLGAGWGAGLAFEGSWLYSDDECSEVLYNYMGDQITEATLGLPWGPSLGFEYTQNLVYETTPLVYFGDEKYGWGLAD